MSLATTNFREARAWSAVSSRLARLSRSSALNLMKMAAAGIQTAAGLAMVRIAELWREYFTTTLICILLAFTSSCYCYGQSAQGSEITSICLVSSFMHPGDVAQLNVDSERDLGLVHAAFQVFERASYC